MRKRLEIITPKSLEITCKGLEIRWLNEVANILLETVNHIMALVFGLRMSAHLVNYPPNNTHRSHIIMEIAPKHVAY